MSLGDDDAKRQAALRAMAHPVRLRILSLLTGASLTAAEVARELDLTHANASYHLRNLLAAGMIVPAGEERIRGGIAKRYRYDADRERDTTPMPGAGAERQALFVAVADELIRRTGQADWVARTAMTDAELWIDPAAWQAIQDRVMQAVLDLHDAAQPRHTPGTIRTSTTVAMFQMDAIFQTAQPPRTDES